MPTLFNPEAVHAPEGAYFHAAEVKSGARLLFLAGQIGRGPDGDIPDDAEGQAEYVYRNILAILADAGMTKDNLVKLTSYVVDPEIMPAVRAAKQRVMGEASPPVTGLVVSRLADPKILIEVEAIAAED